MNKKILTISAAVIVVIALGFGLVKLTNKTPSGGTSAGTPKVNPSRNARELYQQATSLRKDGKLMEARTAYQKIMSDYPNMDNLENVQKEFEDLNLNMIYTGANPEHAVTHEIVSGDTLGKIAKKYNTTVDLIKKMNNLKSDTIPLGKKIKVWNSKFNIYVDKSQNILILRDGNDLIKIYHVSTGADNSTPVGTYKVVNKLVDPVWFKPGAIVPPESPENVLGSRWMGFDLPGYGIHGTVEPDKIGQQVTAGCVRMRNEEVEELYSLVPTGTEVVIVD